VIFTVTFAAALLSMTATVHTKYLRFYPPRYVFYSMYVSECGYYSNSAYSAIGVNVADFGVYANISVSSGINVMIFHCWMSNYLSATYT